MNLVKWTPWREMDVFNDQMSRLFNGPYLPAMPSSGEFNPMDWRPVVDIFEENDNIVIKADLPGVDKDHIEVDLKDRVLTLKGERSHENEVNEDKFYKKETVYGKFQRSFTLPADVNPDKISAEFKDGVLKIEIPKPEAAKPKQISVH